MTVRVLLTATSYPRSEQDWQSIFIRRMTDALAALEGIEVRAWLPAGPMHDRAQTACSPADMQFLAGLQSEGGIAHLLRNRPWLGMLRSVELLSRLHRSLQREAGATDVFHLNWLQSVLAMPPARVPLLVTVLGSDLALLDNPLVAVAVRQALRSRTAILCPNSDWMVPLLKERLGDVVREVKCVPFGIDASWYGVQRNAPVGRKSWITVVRLTKRKIGRLFDWTRTVDRAEHEFHLFGPMQEVVEVPDWVSYHGPASPQQLAEQWFPAATGMISLSEHDEGRPQVLLEAMASGLPVICSRQPAHDELAAGGSRALSAGNPEEFREALSRLSDPQFAGQIAGNARAYVKHEFGSWADCARRYESVYHHLLGA